ncbi:MAG: MOSC domain-containing protein [Janthinobacterium lividum]
MTALHIGPIAPLGPAGVPSAFVKHRVAGPLLAGFDGFPGDEKADLNVHGGPDKALYGYARASYAGWKSDFPHLADRLVAGSMGENMTIDGDDETRVHIGDRVRIGGALLQVSEPRQPCFKLTLAFEEPRLARTMRLTGRCGWYYRTLEPGVIGEGDAVTLIDRPNEDWPISRFFEVILARALGRDILAEMLAMEGLSEIWKVKALRGLAK